MRKKSKKSKIVFYFKCKVYKNEYSSVFLREQNKGQSLFLLKKPQAKPTDQTKNNNQNKKLK